MACYPGQPPRGMEEQGDPLSDSEHDYKDLAVQHHSTQVIVKWLEQNYHYEQGVCLPRSTIYEHYVDFCEREHVQPVINAASFGKLIRQQFSSLTTRRLGTRGKSKYHYFGLGIKPTSIYYNEEYCKRQKEGMSRKEPDSKKVHPVYPKENPSAVLPPFPDIDKLQLLQNVPKDKLTTFMVMYRTHCQRILDSVSRANFSEVESFLLHFWQAMPPHLLPVLASVVVVDLVALCDTLLYSVISSVLIISPVQSFPESLLQEVLRFCSQLGPWLDSATSGLPESLRLIKQQTAVTFVKTLKRQIAIMELAKATRKALQREDQLLQLYRDWEGLDMHAVLAHVLYAVEPLDVPDSALHVVPELLNQFVSLLEDKTTVEDFVEWGQIILDTSVKPCKDSTKSLLQVSRVFILTWKLFTSKISREITLQNAPSFGTFHLIHMLMDDYLLHILETRVEKQQQKDFERKILVLKDEDVASSDVSLENPLSFPSPLASLEQQNEPDLFSESVTLHSSDTSSSGRIPPFNSLSQTTGLDSPTSSAAIPVSPMGQGTTATVVGAHDIHPPSRVGMGGGVGSLSESSLLNPGMLSSETGPGTVRHHPTSHAALQIAISTPPTSSVISPSLSMSTFPTPPSLSPSLPPSNLQPPAGGTNPLPAFPVLSQPLPPPQPPSLPLSSSAHPPPPGMTQFMQGLQSALAPHQPNSNPFSNHLATGATPFSNPLTSMAGSLGTSPPSLPLLPTLYPYGPYGGVGSVPVVQGGPVNCSGGPGVLPTAQFPSHSLVPAYSSYIPHTMYPSSQISNTPSSTS